MASSYASPIIIDDGESLVAATTTLVNPFASMMAPQPTKNQARVLRDRCFRPPLTYNDKYNPMEPPSQLIKADYSLYDYREPLFDDRPAKLLRFLTGHVLAPTNKRRISS